MRNMTDKRLPPYPCRDYWFQITDRVKFNDLVHKIAQLYECTYPQAYGTAKKVLKAKPAEGETLPELLIRENRLRESIERLIRYHWYRWSRMKKQKGTE